MITEISFEADWKDLDKFLSDRRRSVPKLRACDEERPASAPTQRQSAWPLDSLPFEQFGSIEAKFVTAALICNNAASVRPASWESLASTSCVRCCASVSRSTPNQEAQRHENASSLDPVHPHATIHDNASLGFEQHARINAFPLLHNGAGLHPTRPYKRTKYTEQIALPRPAAQWQ